MSAASHLIKRPGGKRFFLFSSSHHADQLACLDQDRQNRPAGHHPSSWADPTYHPTMFGGWGLGFRNGPRMVLDLTQGHGRARVLYGNSFVAPVSPQAPSVGYCSISRPPEEAPEQTRCGSMRRRSPAAEPAFVLFQFGEKANCLYPVSQGTKCLAACPSTAGALEMDGFTSKCTFLPGNGRSELVDRGSQVLGPKISADATASRVACSRANAMPVGTLTVHIVRSAAGRPVHPLTEVCTLQCYVVSLSSSLSVTPQRQDMYGDSHSRSCAQHWALFDSHITSSVPSPRHSSKAGTTQCPRGGVGSPGFEPLAHAIRASISQSTVSRPRSRRISRTVAGSPLARWIARSPLFSPGGREESSHD
jgi:hypothetical protein